MHSNSTNEVYSPREIAQAAGVSEEQVIAAIGGVDAFVCYADAVRLGRVLAGRASTASAGRAAGPLFSTFLSATQSSRPKGVPLALSSTLHAGFLAAAIFVATFGLAPTAATLKSEDPPAEPMRLVFMATPGPGG